MEVWESADPRTLYTAIELFEKRNAAASGRTKGAPGAGGPQFSG